jgi:hypothetical protein
VQDTNFTPLAECIFAADLRKQQIQVRIFGVHEAPARLTLAPVTQEIHAMPISLRVDCDNTSAALELFEENKRLRAQLKEAKI